MKKKLAAFGVVAVILVLGASLLPLRDWSQDLEDVIGRMNPVAGLVVFCAVAVTASLLLVPAWIFPLVAGAVFGMGWGLLAAVVSGTLSALAAFLVARYLLRARIEKLARKSKSFKAVDQAVAKDPWKVVALLRMSPVMPSGVKSYFLGLTRVNLPDYAVASMAGMFPGVLLKVYIGSAGRGALSDGGPLEWSLLAAGIVATIALTVIVGRKVRRRLDL
jgi:uncharacterized membrane protein YdjX (TVP38/TMEM64 family)